MISSSELFRAFSTKLNEEVANINACHVRYATDAVGVQELDPEWPEWNEQANGLNEG